MTFSRRVLVWFLCLTFGAAGFAGSAASHATDQSVMRPLILVHGLGGSPKTTWGWGQKNGFAAGLENAGYTPGVTLFALDYSDDASGDYTQIARRLHTLIDTALLASGSSEVDLMGHSMGGLVTRYLALSEGYPKRIANLVSLCTPNRGSYAATAALIEQYALGMRQLPSSVSSAWRTECAALYKEYVVSRMWDSDPALTAMGFEEWLALNKPVVIQAIFADRESRKLNAFEDVPSPEEGLSPEFYDYVALLLAKREHVDNVGIRKKDSMATRVLNLIKQTAGRIFFGGVTRAMNIESGGPAVQRMVDEYVKVPVGRENGEFVHRELLANWFLNSWNENDALMRTITTPEQMSVPRHINYMVATAGSDRLIAPHVGLNDLAVQVDSAYVVQAPDDVYALFDQRNALHHGSLLQDAILPAELARKLGFAQTNRFGREDTPKTVRLSDWAPVYLAIPKECDGLAFHSVLDQNGVIVNPVSDSVRFAEIGAQPESDRSTFVGLRLAAGALTHLFENSLEVELDAVLSQTDEYPLPQIVVKQGRATTRRRAIFEDGYTVKWNFGDGELGEADIEDAVSHVYDSPGEYKVCASAKNEWDETTSKWEWLVQVAEFGQTLDFDLPIPFIPEPHVHVTGPAKWVTGRPATFSVRVTGLAPNGTVTRIDPGEEFSVVWAKPDRHPVRATATVKYVFELDGIKLSVTRTYPGSTTVDVMAFHTAG